MADNRRPMRFWGPFNDWWRSELEHLGRRPDAQEIVNWYNKNAQAVWGDEAPTLLEARVHAKALRPVTGSSGKTVRDYFRRHRAQRIAGRERRHSKGHHDSEEYDDYDDHMGYASPAPQGSMLNAPMALFQGPDGMPMMAMGPGGWGMPMMAVPGMAMPMQMMPMAGAWDPAAMGGFMAVPAGAHMGFVNGPLPGMPTQLIAPSQDGEEGPDHKRRRHTTTSVPDEQQPEQQQQQRRYSGPSDLNALLSAAPAHALPSIPDAAQVHADRAAMQPETRTDDMQHSAPQAASPSGSGRSGPMSSEGGDSQVVATVVVLPHAGHDSKAPGAKISMEHGLDLSDGTAPAAPHNKQTPSTSLPPSAHDLMSLQRAGSQQHTGSACASPRNSVPAARTGAGLELLTSAAALVSDPADQSAASVPKAHAAVPLPLPIPAQPQPASGEQPDAERQQQELVASYMFAQAQLQAQQMLAYQLAFASFAAGTPLPGGASQGSEGGAAGAIGDLVGGAAGAAGAGGPALWQLPFGTQPPPALQLQEVHGSGAKRGRPA